MPFMKVNGKCEIRWKSASVRSRMAKGNKKKVLRYVHLVTAYTAGIATCTAVVLTIWTLWLDPSRQLAATIRGVPWRLPASAVSEIQLLESLRKGIETSHFLGPESMARETVRFAAQLPEHAKGDDQKDLSWLDKVKSLYLIEVRNEGRRSADNVQVYIPGAIFIEVTCEVAHGPQLKTYVGSQIVPLDKIYGGRRVSVAAWTTASSDRSEVARVRISTDLGSARIKVETPVRRFARLVDSTMFMVFTICLGALVVTLLSLWKKMRFIVNRYS